MVCKAPKRGTESILTHHIHCNPQTGIKLSGSPYQMEAFLLSLLLARPFVIAKSFSLPPVEPGFISTSKDTKKWHIRRFFGYAFLDFHLTALCRFAYALGPASTRALPASLPVYFLKFFSKREARSFAFASHSAASAYVSRGSSMPVSTPGSAVGTARLK